MSGTIIAVQFTSAEEIKALPLLLRHASGTMLRDRVDIISRQAGDMLRRAGIEFRLLSSDVVPQVTSLRSPGKRI